MSKWKYCIRMRAYFFPLSGAVRSDVFFLFFFNKTNLFFFFFLVGEHVRGRAGNAFQLPSAEEKPVGGQGWLEEGSEHTSIFIYRFIRRPLTRLDIVDRYFFPTDNISSSNGCLRGERRVSSLLVCARHPSR